MPDEDAQMILVPYFAISYGFNFEKNVKVHPSVVPGLTKREGNV